VVATGGKDREARERARLYRARQEFHASRVRRRRRDDLIAGIVGGVIVLAAVGAQVAYFTAGPGAPEPTQSPAPSSSETPAPAPTTTGEPAPTSEPTGSETPAG
jgi:hypothetical protein